MDISKSTLRMRTRCASALNHSHRTAQAKHFKGQFSKTTHHHFVQSRRYNHYILPILTTNESMGYYTG